MSVAYPTKNCLICGQEYTPTGTKQKYCQKDRAEGRRLTKAARAAVYYQENRALIREKQAAYYTENIEAARKQSAIYRSTHRDEIRVSQAVYREKHREALRAWHKDNWRENREDLRAKARARYAAHRPEMLERSRVYRAENSELRRAQQAKYREANREILLAKQRAYINQNRATVRAREVQYRHSAKGKEVVRRIRAARRSMTMESPGLPSGFADSLRQEQCYMPGCGTLSESIDHLTPFAKGGMDEPDNVAGACRSCNSTKKDKDPETFFGDHYLAAIEAAFDQQARAWDRVALLGEGRPKSTQTPPAVP